MRNRNLWRPTKFVPTNKGWLPTNNTNEIRVGSRFVTTIQIDNYSKYIQNHASGKLLDLGCGKVPYYGIYKDLVSNSVCIDWNMNQYLDLQADINNDIPIQKSTFDTILCSDVLEHIYNHFNLFFEISRLLRPNGKLILFVPFLYFLHEIPYDYFRYTEYSLRELSKNSNLEIISLEAYGGVPEIVLDIIAKALNFNGFLSLIHCRLSLFLVHTKFVKLFSNKSKQRFPLGYCLIAKKI